MYSEEMVSVLWPLAFQSPQPSLGGGSAPSPFAGWSNLKNETSERGDAIRFSLEQIMTMDISAECEKLLNLFGTAGYGIKSHAGNVEVFDSQGGSTPYAQLYRHTPAFSAVQSSTAGKMSIHDALNADPTKIKRAAATLRGNEIFINNKYWSWNGRSKWNNAWTLMHEMIHNLTGLVDEQLEEILKQNHIPTSGRGLSTNAITAALQGECQ